MRNYVTYLHDNADGDSEHDDSVDGCHVASDGQLSAGLALEADHDVEDSRA